LPAEIVGLNPTGAWIFICCECRVLSGRDLCDELITGPEESYRLCCAVVCDLETSRICVPFIYDISSLRVNIHTYSKIHMQFRRYLFTFDVSTFRKERIISGYKNKQGLHIVVIILAIGLQPLTKSSSPLKAIWSFLFQFTVPSIFLKVNQWLLKSSSSSPPLLCFLQ